MKYTHQHEGKIPYYSEGEVREIMRNFNGKRPRSYVCYIGGQKHWHLTSKTKQQYKKTGGLTNMSDYIKEKVEEFREKFVDNLGKSGGRVWKIMSTDKLIEEIESFLSQAIERVEKEVREEERRKIKNELTGNCTCYCHRLGSQEICEECQDRYGLLSSQEEDLVEGNIDKAMKSFGLEEKWFCTKHQLNHGQKYKSCVGNKEENKPKPEERIAKNFAKLEQKRTHAAEKRRELAETGERSECTEHEGPCFHKLEEEKKEELIDGHKKTCRWIRTTEDECAYRATHYFCPHDGTHGMPDHRCDCNKEVGE